MFAAALSMMLAAGNPPPSRPAFSGRVVRVFDFEEHDTNPGEVPRDWYRGQDNPTGERRAGFPDWNKASLSYRDEHGEAYGGEGSVMLPTQGGSTSLILSAGAAPVFEGAEYVVSARVRTKDLKHAGAAIAGRLLDKSNHPIPGAAYRSAAVRSEGEWTDVSVGVPADAAGAAFLQIELLVLQPEQAETQLDAPFKIWPQDFRGGAWFDDVTIMQPPRARLWTDAPGNCFLSTERPALRYSVKDLTGEELTLSLQLRDIDGTVIATHSRPLGANTAEDTWDLPAPAFGWYRATLNVLSKNERVGGTSTDIVWFGPEAVVRTGDSQHAAGVRAQSIDRSKFGISIGAESPISPSLPEVIRRLGAGAATIPVSTEPSKAALVMPLVDALLADWRTPTFSVPRVSPAIAQQLHISPEDAWSMMLADSTVWLPALAPLADRYGQRVQRWQIGPADGSSGLMWRKDLWTEVAKVRGALSASVAGPILAVPSGQSAYRPVPKTLEGVSLVQAVSLSDPSDIVGATVGAWKDEGQSTGTGELTVFVNALAPERYGIAAGPVQLVKHLVSFWGAVTTADGATLPNCGISVSQPWRGDGTAEGIEPLPELAAMHTAIRMLEDRRVTGAFPIADGVRCWILAPAPDAPKGRGGALVAWNERAAPGEAVIQSFLGLGKISVCDIYGNKHEAPRTPDLKQARIPLTFSPVFVEGIDIEFARFLAGFRVEPAILESNNKLHPREVVMENPWDQTITGQITILEPGGFEGGVVDRSWRVSPRVMKFSIPSRKTQRVPFSVSFNPSQEVGPRDFVFEVNLAAAETYRPVEIRRQIEIGLADLSLELSYSIRGDHGEDLVIEAAVSNASQRSLTLDLTAFAPDLPRAKTAIVDLVGGNQAVRRMTFTNGLAAARGKKVVVTVRDTGSEARVTKSILIR